mmetsp:Transcript_49504/g.117832  ORF Transcript_49504/g.117832 Transcript_49504/m.117832 type:complete len:398 (-) Transcript_49504:179-1372(-)
MGASQARRLPVHEKVDPEVHQRYHVGRRIGRGQYGVVFEAESQEFEWHCAIKKIMYAFRNAGDAQRTYREVSYLLEFAGHPNIIAVRDVMCSRDDKHLYICCDIMEGDLFKALRNTVFTPIHRSLITYDLLRALKYIHSAGVVHRDVKPANILLSSACDVKLADFGWARSVPVPGDESVMTDYAATRWYRAPEMLLGGRFYSTPVDMWALGCIVAEMRLRHPLLPGTCTMNMMDRILELFGKPLPSDIQAMEAIHDKYFQSVEPEPPRQTIAGLFPNDPLEFVDMLQLLLQVHPEKRMTADEAMNHPCVAAFHNPDDDPTFGRYLQLQLTDTELHTAGRYRDQIYADIIGLPLARKRIDELQAQEEEEILLMHGIETPAPARRLSSETSSSPPLRHL